MWIYPEMGPSKEDDNTFFRIDFLKETKDIAFVMRICRNVGNLTHQGNTKKLDDLDSGGYSNVLYHQKHQIPLNLYIYRDEETFKEPMYLISNVYQDAEIYHCYKRRMQIEHGFRDIKTRFGFRITHRFEKTRESTHRTFMVHCLSDLWTDLSLL